MDANEFKDTLSMQDIYSLLDHLGADPVETNIGINARTVCHNHHGEGKHNLRFYEDSKTLNCFSECGFMSIYDFVGKVLDLDFFESFKYVLSFFNQSIYDMKMTTISYEDDNDTGFFYRDTVVEDKPLPIIDEKVMNIYYHLYYQGWIDEGISCATMNKYNIQTSVADQQIIIPHYDEDGRLVGVRCRNLNNELVEQGKKYMPVINNGEMLNHSTGSVLYGLNFNKDNINRVRKVILFESEKSVMKLDSYMPDMSIGVCLSGSSLTNKQVDILRTLNIDEVIVALDKEYHKIGDNEEKYFAKKIEDTILKKLDVFYNVSVIWDMENKLNYKDAPVDQGKEVFEELLQNRIILN